MQWDLLVFLQTAIVFNCGLLTNLFKSVGTFYLGEGGLKNGCCTAVMLTASALVR